MLCTEISLSTVLRSISTLYTTDVYKKRDSAKCDRRLVIRWRFRDGEFNVNNSPITDRLFKTERDIASMFVEKRA